MSLFLHLFSMIIKGTDLEKIVKEKDEEINKLKQNLEIERFSIERFSKDNPMILFHIGFISYSLFITVYEFVKPAANTMTSYYYQFFR